MKPFNINSSTSTIDEDKNFEINDLIKKRKLEKYIKSFNVDSNDINKILEKLSKDTNKNNKKDEKDIVFEMYNNNLLTPELVQKIMENRNKNLNMEMK